MLPTLQTLQPLHKATPEPAEQTIVDRAAEQASLRALLNCYCREIATPKRLWTIFSAVEIRKQDPKLVDSLKSSGPWILKIFFPNIQTEVSTSLQTLPSLAGTFDFERELCFQTPFHPWIKLSAWDCAQLIHQEMCAVYHSPKDPDFLVQVQDSIRVLKSLFKEHKAPSHLDFSFLESEQSLFLGHPFHPSPKSRLGFSDEDLRKYSPELKGSFALEYFSVPTEYVVQNTETTNWILKENPELKEVLLTSKDRSLVPVHPWQATNLMKSPEFRNYLETKGILYLGPIGKIFYPTSSVRTVYSPRDSYFYKLSLHVRITNCFRRNALSELQSAVEISKTLSHLKPELSHTCPNLVILEEPAFLTVQLPHCQTPALQRLNESFGLLLRTNIDFHPDRKSTPILSGSLFGNGEMGRKKVRSFIPSSQEKESWFERYLQLMIPPFFHLFFEFGIMFEPHLQNTLIGMLKQQPVQVFIRDLDNVRLLEDYPVAKDFSDSHPSIASGILYDEEQGFNRLTYCLIVNHLCEAIYQLSYGVPSLEQKLWSLLKEVLLDELSVPSKSRHVLSRLISGQSLPAKANLIARFQRTPDHRASYVELPHPFR